jgi:hypothetical protein
LAALKAKNSFDRLTDINFGEDGFSNGLLQACSRRGQCPQMARRRRLRMCQ